MNDPTHLDDLYVADLASRTPGRGRILRFANFGRGAPVVVLSGLNQPNGLAAGSSGKLYVGEVGMGKTTGLASSSVNGDTNVGDVAQRAEEIVQIAVCHLKRHVSDIECR